MIFLDGVGIGKADFQFNPFFKFKFKTFTDLFGGIPSLDNQYLKADNKFLFPVDANLDVDGLPQSGTGQTSIFCGINAAKMINKHFGPYPYSTLIPHIKEENIFASLLKLNRKVFFANAYPKIFFDYLKSGKQRLSVTTLSCRLSGVRLNNASDVRKAKALTAEITNERWNQKLGYKLRIISPAAAAKRLLSISEQNHFTLYEYFLTDHIGHSRYDGEITSVIRNLDEFLLTVITKMNYRKSTLLICSDHGNFEDLSVKTHTRNPSIALTAGLKAESLADNIKDLTQIKSSVINII